MSSLIFILFIASVAGFIGYLVYLNHQRVGGWIYRNTIGQVDWVLEQLDGMFIEINRNIVFWAIVGSSFGLGFVAFLLCIPNFFLGSVLGILSFIIGAKLPRPFLRFLSARRQRIFNSQLIDGLTLMANGLKSGLSLNQALAIVINEMPNPLSQEFNLILSQNKVGVPLEDAFRNLAERIPLEDVEMFTSSVVILRETGGNIAETFETISHTIRERNKVENKISAMTRQGRLQGVIVALMPFLLGFIFYTMDPEHIKPMFTHWLGIVLILIMLTLQTIGALAIKKIVTIKV